MTDTKDDGYWGSWMPAHQQLVAAPLPWPEQAYGYRWQTGATGDWLGRWPLPVHAAALLARRSSPATFLAAMTADALANATRCIFTTLHPHHPHHHHHPPPPPSTSTTPPSTTHSPPSTRTVFTTLNTPTLTPSPPHRPHYPLQAVAALPLGRGCGRGGGAGPGARLCGLQG